MFHDARALSSTACSRSRCAPALPFVDFALLPSPRCSPSCGMHKSKDRGHATPPCHAALDQNVSSFEPPFAIPQDKHAPGEQVVAKKFGGKFRRV